MKALLIIDMQKGSFTASPLRHDSQGVVRRINLIADAFRAGSLPVLYTQHDGTSAGEFVPGTSAWELLDDLDVKADDVTIVAGILGTQFSQIHDIRRCIQISRVVTELVTD